MAYRKGAYVTSFVVTSKDEAEHRKARSIQLGFSARIFERDVRADGERLNVFAVVVREKNKPQEAS
jgi:hypothetical protein